MYIYMLCMCMYVHSYLFIHKERCLTWGQRLAIVVTTKKWVTAFDLNTYIQGSNTFIMLIIKEKNLRNYYCENVQINTSINATKLNDEFGLNI